MAGKDGEAGSDVRPRRRWGRWIGFFLLGLVALLILGHAFWGAYEERELTRRIQELRNSGEPMLVEDFRRDKASIPEG